MSRRGQSHAPRVHRPQQDTVGHNFRRWQWLSGTVWQDYEPDACKALTLAKDFGHSSCLIRTPVGLYQVDLDRMRQRPHVGYGQERAVRENPIGKDFPMSAGASRRGASNRGQSIDLQRSSFSTRKDVDLRSNLNIFQDEPLVSPSQMSSMLHPLFYTVRLVLKRGYSQGPTLRVRAANGDPAGAIVDVAQQMRVSWTWPATFSLIWDRGATPEIFIAGTCLGLFFCGFDEPNNPPSFEIDATLDSEATSKIQNAWGEFQTKARLYGACCEMNQFPSREGGYHWIQHENSPRSRLERLAGAVSSLRHGFNQGSKRSLIEGTRLVYGNHATYPRGHHQTSLEHAESHTVLDQAILQKSRHFKAVVVVSAASAYQVGGGFLTGGRHALEESMCTQSDLYFSLQKAAELAKQENLRDHDQRPVHIPENGAILSPDVRIFRHGTMKGYEFSKAPVMLDAVISIAMPNQNCMVRDSPCNYRSWNKLKPVVSQKFEAVLSSAMQKQAEVLIVPDVGCGVFKNDPHEVGTALGEKLRDFPGVFQKVILTGSREFAEAVGKASGLTLKNSVVGYDSLADRSRPILKFGCLSVSRAA